MAQKVNIELLKKAILEVNPRVRTANFNAQTDLFEEGILDSYSVIQLVNTFEERFGIVFDYGDLKAAYFRNLVSLMGILTTKYKVEEGKNLPADKKKAAKKAGAAKKAKKIKT
jgi:acyl carrier protein